jgi:hypothetical protein
MRASRIALAAAIALAVFVPQAVAEEAVEASAELTQEPAAPAASEASAPAPDTEADQAPDVEPVEETQEVELGPVSRDEQGRAGRIHVVLPGDTLWDISDAYLGTPWVWPSVWQDNQGIENPHLIFPADKIWITAREMRKLTEEEAARLQSPALSGEGMLPASMEDAAPGSENAPRPTYRYSKIDTAGFLTLDQIQGASTIVDSHEQKVWLSESDTVIIGRGAGDVEVGDQLEIFRPGERVYDPKNGDVFGFATKQLGWLEIDAVQSETSTGTIRVSRSEIRRGDHVLPRVRLETEIEIGPKPEVDGQIVFTPDDRLVMGMEDVVFLDRGTSHGLDVGSPLEVYRPIGDGFDSVQQKKLVLPDSTVAKLLVVTAGDETAVALVTETMVELSRGDRFRGSDSVIWSASE